MICIEFGHHAISFNASWLANVLQGLKSLLERVSMLVLPGMEESKEADGSI